MKKSRSRQPRTKTLFFKQMRKAKPKKRLILPDPVFNDQKVSKFVNHLMYDGKKNTSYEIFYAALETVKAKLPNEEKSALEIWKKALDNVTPQVEVKSRRVGGATFQVPTEIRPDRHLLNSLFDHGLVRIGVNQESVFLLAHCVHALLGYNRFQNDVIVLNVSHYAYTSSIFATAALVATTVLYFKMSYTLIVLTLSLIHI